MAGSNTCWLVSPSSIVPKQEWFIDTQMPIDTFREIGIYWGVLDECWKLINVKISLIGAWTNYFRIPPYAFVSVLWEVALAASTYDR